MTEKIKVTYYNLLGKQTVEGTRENLQGLIQRLDACDLLYQIEILA